MKKTFIFDLDDTIIPNQHDYSYAQIEFFKWLETKLGYRCPDLQSIINLESNIDTENVKKFGFKMERFPTSMMETYLALTTKLNIASTEEDAMKAYEIGMTAFGEARIKKNGLLPGARETLNYLHAKGDELYLMTKGDERVQTMKIKINGLTKWFSPEKIHIVPKKDANTLIALVNEIENPFIWHVGNSIRSDVEPALGAGINVIYIPCETWQYERDHNGYTPNPKILKLDNLLEIKTKYQSIFQE